VKTLDRFGLGDGDALHPYLLGGVVVELRFNLGFVLVSSVASFGFPFFYLDLLVRGFPHHIVSVRPLWLYL
jgi:hypothetical protein